MSSSPPLSTARAIWTIARLSMRRQVNMWQSVRLARKRNRAQSSGGQVRSATPTKASGRGWLSALLFLVLGFNGLNIGCQGLMRLSETTQNVHSWTDKISVSASTQATLRQAEAALKRAGEIPSPVERKEYEDTWRRYADDVLLAEVRHKRLTEDDENQQLQQMRDVFAQRGADGFIYADSDRVVVSGETWPRPEQAKSVFLRSLNLIVLLWIPLIVCGALGTNTKDLGQVEWNFEWLYTFPVSARALFVSKIFVYAFLNPLVWVLLFPFLVLIYVAGGHGLNALPLGLIALLYLSLLAGALTTILEVAVRKFLSLSRLKNMQALFTVISVVALLLIYASALSKPLVDFLVNHAVAMPAAVVWNPFSLPLILAMPDAPAGQAHVAAGGMVLSLLIFCAFALFGSEWLTRDGLIKAGGPYQGARRMGKRSLGGNWFRGVASKELLLLGRDRNLMVQVLIVPLLIPAFYLLIYSGMLSAVSGNLRHAAMMAFAVGAYSFLNSAMPVLNREDKTLWFLLSMPQSLTSVLAKKTMVWASIGLVYGTGLLLALLHFSRHLQTTSWGDVFLSLYGIVIYAFIAAGIGILATNLFETEKRARFRTDMVYLYMILASMYSNVIYSTSAWAKLAQAVLSTLLAFAMWQKVKDNSPYLLDPVALPPRNVSLADGLIAGLAFFVMQSLMVMFLHLTSALSASAEITLAYVIAGLIVSSATLLILKRQGIFDLALQVGFALGENGKSRLLSIFQGAAWGGAAALAAFLYMRVLSLVPSWRMWEKDAQLSSFLTRSGSPIWISILAIAAAPVFEEFLFRGLIFRGLRRTTGPFLAVLGSAAVFALIHPPVAVIPVFVLGIATAISFHKSDFLLASITTHAVYNACVMFLHKP